MSDWVEALSPCHVPPVSKITVNFWLETEKPISTVMLTLQGKVTSILMNRKIPWAYFPSENKIITCRMMFIFNPKEGIITFALDPKEDKAAESIEFAMALLKEAGFVNGENEQKVRKIMMKKWDKWRSAKTVVCALMSGLIDCD
jgi:hypothetical protein